MSSSDSLVKLTARKPMTAKDRAVRLEIHKMHVIALLASARVRNTWASDEVLQVGQNLSQ